MGRLGDTGGAIPPVEAQRTVHKLTGVLGDLPCVDQSVLQMPAIRACSEVLHRHDLRVQALQEDQARLPRLSSEGRLAAVPKLQRRRNAGPSTWRGFHDVSGIREGEGTFERSKQ